MISAVSLDEEMRRYFANNDLEVIYGNAKTGPVLFQDDVARLSDSVEGHSPNNNVESLLVGKSMNRIRKKSSK